MNAGGSRSGRVERTWPSLQKVGPSSSSADRSRRACSRCGSFFLGGARAGRGGNRHGLAVEHRRVHDDHVAARIVRDAVGNVAEQELLAPGHAGVADDQGVDLALLGDLQDGAGGVVVYDYARFAARAGELAGELGERVGEVAGLRGLRRAALGAGRRARRNDLHDEQRRLVAVGHRGRPPHGTVGGLGPVGRDHDPPQLRPGLLAHVLRIMRDRPRRCRAPPFARPNPSGPSALLHPASKSQPIRAFRPMQLVKAFTKMTEKILKGSL